MPRNRMADATLLKDDSRPKNKIRMKKIMEKRVFIHKW